ncbi:MAG: glycosyltransferase [Lachnospiraceae bacterium]|nr:glycosyltransferase [Lachnospiraceae bacterium]
MNDIAVSVIVVVNNRADYLDRCIDSLVFQTLKNIEVLIVDDYSTDSSWTIMEKWQNRFPDIINVMKSEQKGVTHAKNTGIKHARGKYVTIVESGDYIDYKMLKRMYGKAQTSDFPEIVFSPIWEVDGNNKRKSDIIKEHEAIENYLKLNEYGLTGRLFRRDLFERYGLLPELGIGEDLAWLFPAISNEPSIVYYCVPGYYHERSPQSITLDFTNYKIVEDIILGNDILLEKTNEKYREEALLFSVERLLLYGDKRPIYKDVFYKEAFKYIDELKEIEDLLIKSEKLYYFCERYSGEIETIPQIVYVNGFGKEEYNTEGLENVFRDKPQFVILNEDNCDVLSCPEVIKKACENHDWCMVGKYFAVKKCYENGGIYIDDDIEVEAPFNMFLYDLAFFGYESNNSFTDKVFGCVARSKIFAGILKTYECVDLYDNYFESLASRIKTILISMGGVTLQSKYHNLVQYGFCLYPIETFVFSLPSMDCVHVSHYKNKCVENPVRISENVLESLLYKARNDSENDAMISEVKEALSWNRKQVKILEDQLEWNRGQVEKYKNQLEWNRGQVETYKEQLEWNRGQVETYKERIEKSRNRVTTLEGQLKWNRNQVEIYKERCEKNKEKITTLESQLEWNREQKAIKENENSKLKEANSKLKTELSEYKGSILVRIAWKLHRIPQKLKNVFKK